MGQDSAATETNVLGTIYFTGYMIVAVIIIFGAHKIASHVRLYQESSTFLLNIKHTLSTVTICINAFEAKYNANTRPEKRKTVNFINIETMEFVINSQFNEILTQVQNHKLQLLNKIHQIKQSHDKFKELDHPNTKSKQPQTLLINTPMLESFNTIASHDLQTIPHLSLITTTTSSINNNVTQQTPWVPLQAGSPTTPGTPIDERIDGYSDLKQIDLVSQEQPRVSRLSSKLLDVPVLTSPIAVASRSTSSIVGHDHDHEMGMIGVDDYKQPNIQLMADQGNNINGYDENRHSGTYNYGFAVDVGDYNNYSGNKYDDQLGDNINGIQIIGDDDKNHNNINININDNDGKQELIKVKELNDYIRKQYEKLNIHKSRGILTYFITLLNLRSLFIPCLAHFFDTASDISLVIEWYILYNDESFNDNKNDRESIAALFFCSLIVIVYYRLSSTYEIYLFSRSKYDALLQFLFDFYLIKAVYVNIHKMNSYKALSFIKIIRGLEGSTESAFQAVLALVFLLKFYNYNKTDIITGTQITVAIASLTASLLSLISKMLFQDKALLIPEAQDSGISLYDIFVKFKIQINVSWLIFVTWRSLDVTINIITLALYWHIVGGLIFGLVFGLGAVLYVFFSHYTSGTVAIKFVLIFVRTPFSQFENDRRPAFFIGFRCIHSLVILIFFCVQNYKYTLSMTIFVYVTFILSVIVIPLMCYIILKKLKYIRRLDSDERLKHNEHWTTTTGFDIGQAIFASDLEFIIFSRSMGANLFYDYTWMKQYRAHKDITSGNKSGNDSTSSSSGSASSDDMDTGCCCNCNCTCFLTRRWIAMKIEKSRRNLQIRKISIIEGLSMSPYFHYEIYEYLKKWFNNDHEKIKNKQKRFHDNINKCDGSSINTKRVKSDDSKRINMDAEQIVTFEQYLASVFDNFMAFTLARRARNIQIFEILKQGGLDLSDYNFVQKDDGRTLLHQAVLENDSVDVIEWIIKNGFFDINCRNRGHYRTPLHVLMWRIQKQKKVTRVDRQIFHLLLKYGIDLFAQDDTKWQMVFGKDINPKVALFLCEPL